MIWTGLPSLTDFFNIKLRNSLRSWPMKNNIYIEKKNYIETYFLIQLWFMMVQTTCISRTKIVKVKKAIIIEWGNNEKIAKIFPNRSPSSPKQKIVNSNSILGTKVTFWINNIGQCKRFPFQNFACIVHC